MAKNFAVLAKNKVFIPFASKDEEQWQGPFAFIQAADTQFGMQEKFIEGRSQPGWSQEIAWSKKFVEDVNQMSPRPKFAVVCGDLLDAWPTTEAEVRALQEKDFKKVFAELEIPLVCVCGNHDVGNQPTYDTVSRYKSSFGDDYFSFWCGGVFFIVLNSQYHEDASQVPKLATKQEAWLEEQLEIVRRRKPLHTVVFQHIPYFLFQPDEEKEYFNYEVPLRQAMLERLHTSGVRYIFCGHYHRNAGGFYKDLELVVTSAVGTQLGDADHGYRIVKVLQDGIEHRYYGLGKAPKGIYLPNSKKGATTFPGGPLKKGWTTPEHFLDESLSRKDSVLV